MLKILDEKVLRADEEIRKLYKDCKYVYIIDSYDKAVDDEGKICVLGGSYNNGGAVGVQYEIKG